MGNKLLAALTLSVITAIIPGTGLSQGTVMIEDFQSYTTGVGNWTSSGSGITANLSLGTGTGEDKTLMQALGVGALNANYTIANTTLNVSTPPTLQQFVFEQGATVALSVGRNVQVTLTNSNNDTFISPQQAMPTLVVGSPSNITFDLTQFTPNASAGAIGTLTGVSLKYTISLASLGAQEYIDDIRFTYNNSSIQDWTVY